MLLIFKCLSFLVTCATSITSFTLADLSSQNEMFKRHLGCPKWNLVWAISFGYLCLLLLLFFQSHSPGPIHWDFEDIKFLINTEGCGYPPGTNCTNFVKQYGLPQDDKRRKEYPKPFPCYYSKVFPTLHVVSRYNWDQNLKFLILALVVPLVLFFGSLTILGYWYCPRKSKVQPAYI